MSRGEKEPIVKAPERRVRRTPLGTRNVLTISGKEPGYHYRVVNDDGDRIADFLDNGWEIVPKEAVRVGDKRLGNPSGSEGTAAIASVGGGKKGYILRIREDWHQEDQKAKQEYVDQTEAATKEKALDGTYGELKITRGS